MKMFYRDRHGHHVPAVSLLGALVIMVPIAAACVIGIVLLGGDPATTLGAAVFIAIMGNAANAYAYREHKKYMDSRGDQE